MYFIISHYSRELHSSLLLVKYSVTPHSVPGKAKENNYMNDFIGKTVCFGIFSPGWPLEHSRVLEMIGSLIIQLAPARPVSCLPLTLIPAIQLTHQTLFILLIESHRMFASSELSWYSVPWPWGSMARLVSPLRIKSPNYGWQQNFKITCRGVHWPAPGSCSSGCSWTGHCCPSDVSH